MASVVQRSGRFSNFLLVALWVLLGMVRLSHGSVSYFKPSKWTLAHATFYGDDTASATMGGACGYGNLFNNGYGVDTTALSTVLFNNGYACGSCYQLKCVQSPWCNHVSGGGGGGYGGSSGGSAPTIAVTATNLCPPNWYEPSDAGGWCNPPRQHFDLSKPAFEKLAFWKAGIIPVMYRRVPCPRKGGIRFYFQGNPYWLLVYVMNVGGAGDISKMWVKGSKTSQWLSMSHNWGASYQAFAQLAGQSLSFKLKSYSTGETLIAYNVAPQYWTVGMTYQANVNFKA